MPYISPELLILVLGLSGIEIESVSIDSQNDLIIRVKSTSEGTRCHRCGCHISKPCHPGKEIKLRHLAVSGYRTYIVITPPRYQCTHLSHGNNAGLPVDAWRRKTDLVRPIVIYGGATDHRKNCIG
jgi:transposase